MLIEWILPVTIIFTGFLIGVIAETFFSKKLKKHVIQNTIPGSEVLFDSLHWMTFIWFVLISCYIAALIYSEAKPGIADAFKRIIIALFLSSVTLVLARLTGGFVGLYIRRTEGVPASLFSNIAKTTVLVLGTLIVLQTSGIQITPVLTTLGITGLAVGLALKDTLENLFAGFYLILSKQIRTGDYLKLENGNEGYVTDITWRHTTIREIANNEIIVPNAKLSSAIFTNYHLPKKEIVTTIQVGIDYDSNLEQVEEVTVQIAKEVMQEIAPELIVNSPYIRYHKFSDYSIDFTVYLRVNEYFDQRLARHLFIKKLHKRYQKEGIKIPSPNVEVFLEGNK